MELTILAAVLVGVAVLAILVAVFSIATTDRSIDTRLGLYLEASPDNSQVVAGGAEEGSVLAERLNSALSQVSFAEGIRRSLARADVPLTVPEYLLLKIGATLVPAAATLVLTRSLLALPPVALIGFFLPTLWLRQRQRRRLRLFGEQLPDMLSTIIGSLRGGFSLVQSLGNVAKEAPSPTGPEIRRVTQEIQLGLSVGEALGNLAKRMESQDLELLVAVLRIHARVGGNLTTVLENISGTIRERTRLQREIQVITAQQRYASYVLGLLPVILALILMVINPAYMLKLFEPGPLLVIPIGAVIFTAAGFMIIQKIVDIKV